MQEHVPLKGYTTFGIGGLARYFATVRSLDELRDALALAKEKSLRVFILGGGSNVLVSDTGFDGLVIKVELMGVEQDGETVAAGAGESWDRLVEHTIANGLWGIENLSGIPGAVGGAVVGSIGAYGQAVAKTVAWVEAYDLALREVKKVTNEQCRFGYRESVFSAGGYVVLRAAFALSARGSANASYMPHISRLNLDEIRQQVLAIRRNKFPDLLVEGTAGSFFKNPIVGEAEAARLQKRYPGLPTFDMPETTGVKIPLAWLLDQILHLKGHAQGGARLYERQPLVIAAQRGASSHEVDALALFVEQKIQKEFGIVLEREVKTIF